ncbi:unnamed protein product [Prunus armeniaca]|uniref:TATA-box-binding protein n=1 Tax=Prunus armeniaca TaxID=36596 RepID=A0A6J5XY33_PRUAR|nr:unnamed protein product [Prunus armeniaca]
MIEANIHKPIGVEGPARISLDLRQIALQARNAEYNPKRFAAIILRIREPKTTALIFASGKMYLEAEIDNF